VSARERRKGARGELEVVEELHRAGWSDARRTSDGRTQTGRGDVAGGPPGVVWEVRRTERLAVWRLLEDAQRHAANGEIPVGAFRRSRSDWAVVLPLDRFLSLLREREVSQ
jgi:Holliday junction resolvase